jgi:hypothetical protein
VSALFARVFVLGGKWFSTVCCFVVVAVSVKGLVKTSASSVWSSLSRLVGFFVLVGVSADGPCG